MMNTSQEYTFKYAGIDEVIPNCTLINKKLRKFRTIGYSNHSKQYMNLNCWYAFLNYCIEESVPQDNKMRQLKYSLGKCLDNNPKYINKESPYDDMFNRVYFSKYNYKMSRFIDNMKSKLGANGVLSERKNFHKNLQTIFYDKEDIANALCYSMSDKVPNPIFNEREKSEYIENYCLAIKDYFKVSCLIIELSMDKKTLILHPKKTPLLGNAINLLMYDKDNYILYENEFARRAQFIVPIHQNSSCYDESSFFRPFENELNTMEFSYEPMKSLILDVKQRFKGSSRTTPSIDKYKKRINDIILILNENFKGKRFYEDLISTIVKNLTEFIQKNNKSQQKSEANRVKNQATPDIKSILENADKIVQQNFKKDKEILLNCGHNNNIELLKNQSKQMLTKLNCGPRQLICTNCNCFSIIEDQTLLKLLSIKEYNRFIENYETQNQLKCAFCANETSNNRMIKIHLNHFICLNCFNFYLCSIYGGYLLSVNKNLLENHVKFPFEMTKCPIRQCNYYFEIQKINALTEEEIMKEKIMYCKAKGWIAKSHEQRWCPICNLRKYLDDFVIFKNCGHYACEDCFKRMISKEVIIAGYGFERLICFYNELMIPKKNNPNNKAEEVKKEEKDGKIANPKRTLEEMKGLDSSEFAKINCKAPLEYYDTLKIIKDEMSKIEFNNIIAQNNMFNCPKCNTMFIIEKYNKNKYLTCTCGVTSCRICLQDAHKGAPCNLNDRQDKIQMCLQNGKIGICPYCLNIAFKEKAEQCDHVKCILCKTDFNFCCSSKRDVSMAHGLHFHRPDCPHYSNYDDTADPPPKDCPACQKLGKKCPRPKPLDNHDIPKDEWEMKSIEYIENNY